MRADADGAKRSPARTDATARLAHWHDELSRSPFAKASGTEALDQASLALESAEALTHRGDHRAAKRARLVANAALTLASRQQARAATTQELEAARARVEQLKSAVREARTSSRSGTQP